MKTTYAMAIGLLLIIWGIYLTRITTFPVFIDETIHIYTAEKIILNRSPLEDAGLGRLFAGWWLAIFQPAASNPLWVARTVIVLAFLPGLAALMSIGRLEKGRRGALLFGLLYTFSNYHFFYMRLALADPIASSAVALTIYFAYRLSRRQHVGDAIMVGIMLFAAFGIKISTLPYFGIPIAAALTLVPPNHSRKSNIRWAAVALGTGIGLSGLLTVGMRLRGLDYVTNSLSLAASGRGDSSIERIFSLQRIFSNITFSAESLSIYVGGFVFVLLIAALGVLIARRQFYLPLVLLAPTAIIWWNNEQHLRYYPIPMALLFLCAALIIVDGLQKRGIKTFAMVSGAILLWGILQWLPFAQTAFTDPANLQLPEADRNQYILSDASGFGLAEVLNHLESEQASRVIGALSNCQGLRYTASALFRPTIECPQIRPGGQDRQPILELIQASQTAGTFVVLEDSPYVPETVPGHLVTVVYPGRPQLAIYDLSP